MSIPEELYQRIMKLDPATIGHHITGGFMDCRVKPLNPDTKLLGPAYTVKMVGLDSGPLHYAISHAPKGSVLVIDHHDAPEYAPIGEFVSLNLQLRGFSGVVIDGCVTDSKAIRQSSFPVFCTGVSAVVTKMLANSGAVNLPVSCCGTVVNPGDIIFADCDGVLVLPQDAIEEPLKKAEQGMAREQMIREKLETATASGKPVDINQIFPANPDYLEK